MKTNSHRAWVGLVALAVVSGIATQGSIAADSKPPAVWDGLQQVQAKGLDLVYMRENVDFKIYKTILIDTDVPVAFAKNWQKDQNDTRELSRKVDAEDMQKIRASLGKMVHDGLKKELTKNGYTVVDTPAADTLRISPGVADLYINAPDVQSASRSRSYTTNGAGSMTLVLESSDASTGQLLARVVDRRTDTQSGGTISWANSVSNAAQADLAISAWAKRLRQGLDTLTGKTPK